MAGLRKRGRVWYYRFVDADGIKRELPGCPDRRATEELARKAETEAAQIRAGVIDPKALRTTEAARKPIRSHLDDFIGTMEAAGRNPQHVSQTRTYIARIIELSRAEGIADLTPSAVMQAVGAAG